MNENIILNSVVERLQRYSAKYFYTRKYTIENVNWDKANNRAVITLNKTLDKIFGTTEPKIVIEDVPYKWSVANLTFDLITNNILIETTTKTVLHGVLFSGNLLHLSGVQVKKPIYDIDGNITGYEPFIEANEFVNKTYNISQINDRSNTVVALDHSARRGVKDKYINLLYYKSFNGLDNLQFDFTNAQILFYPKEDASLNRINRLYKNTEYTVDATDRKIIYLPLDEYYSQDIFFDTVIAQNSFLYTNPQVEIGDIQAFQSYGKRLIEIFANQNEPLPRCYARIEYDGFAQKVPIESIDDTTATSRIANVKQNYVIRIGIVNIKAPVNIDKTNDFITQSHIIEPLKVNIHNNLVQVLQDFTVQLGFDDLTYSNNSKAIINFDADFSNWEWLDPENAPIYGTAMTIQTVYDEKKISRLEKMIIKEPTATGLKLTTYANAVETPKKYEFND